MNSKEIWKVATYSDWWFPFELGGAEKTARSWALLLNNSGKFDVNVFTPTRKPISNDSLRVTPLRLPFFRQSPDAYFLIKLLEKIRVIFDFISPTITAKNLLNSKPDVIFLHNIDRVGPYLPLILKMMDSKVTIIRVYHDQSDTCILRTRFKGGRSCPNTCWTCKPKEKMNARISNLYSLNIFVSKHLRSALEKSRICVDKFQIIYPMEPYEKEIEARKLSQQKNSLKIAYVGTVSRAKGIETLLSACRIVSTTQQLQLFVYGSGNKRYMKKIKRASKDMDFKIHFEGRVENVFKKIDAEISCVVVPSIWEEPFGKVPIEAALSGLRVISSDAGGLLESTRCISPPQEFFEAGNCIELAEKISLSTFEAPRRIEIPLDSSVNKLPLILHALLESKENQQPSKRNKN
jgi:glycosyltransferase involved in cell wall biosynthesis